MKEEKTSAKGVLLVVAAGVLWGVIGVFSRQLIAIGFSSLGITATRCIVTALFSGIFLLVTDRSKFKISLKDIWMFLGTGVLSIAFFNVCYFLTISYTTLSVASVLLYTAPTFVMLFSALLFREKITPQKIIALVLAFFGCILITGVLFGSENIPLVGILTGIGSGLGYGLYSIFSRYALKKYHPFTVTFYTFAIAAVAVLPFSSFGSVAALVISRPISLVWILLLGFISTLLPFFLYTKGLTYLESSKASVIAFIEPMVATIVGIVLFHEEIDAFGVIGIGLIFESLLLLNIKLTRNRVK